MLKVLVGTHDELIDQSWQMRKIYSDLKSELEPKLSDELDPKVCNPLSVHEKVKFNQRTLITLILETKKSGKTFGWTLTGPFRNSVFSTT